ncbi:hypothetical protein K402DRAFT_388727 [Aulographum hederae CBS 113979]|uniref:Uncharacterized protein n=1 Tax=Aulographum hederae CBS 113979 TaxID=1176131 RepID=A0A6G1HGJ2_9PEZI|nr:hypothetical protein K402DRAFT_388727 [Aulographum hederae CBS 113979]
MSPSETSDRQHGHRFRAHTSGSSTPVHSGSAPGSKTNLLGRHSLHNNRNHDRSHLHRPHVKEAIHTATHHHTPSPLAERDKHRQQHHGQTPDTIPSSTVGSRRESLIGGDGTSEQKIPLHQITKPVKPEDVAKERTRQKARDDELSKTLSSLSNLSLTTTRRLDDLYYSVLDKVAFLRSTIGGLQDLSTMTKTLHEDFKHEAAELGREIGAQIDTFGGFEGQETRIKDMERRVGESRDKATKLRERLEKARERVADLERREVAWQAANSRRARIAWGILGTIVGLCVLFLAVHAWRKTAPTGSGELHHPNNGHQSIARLNMSEKVAGTVPPKVEEILKSVQQQMPKEDGTSWKNVMPTQRAEEEDSRLRMFDEL